MVVTHTVYFMLCQSSLLNTVVSFAWLNNNTMFYKTLTYWITECTSCRTEVFKFMHQRILTQHLANYCCVVSIQGLIVIASHRTSKLDLDQNQSVTYFDQSKQEISSINTKRIMFPQRLFQLGLHRPRLNLCFCFV